MGWIFQWICRWIIRLNPAEVRQSFGGEMWEVARRREAELRESGRSVGLFWVRECGSQVRAVARAWWDARAGGIEWGPRYGSTTNRGGLGGGVESMWNDVRFAIRALRRRPMYVVVATLTLGVGIGATTAIFSVVQSVLFRQLPFPDEDRLVRIWENNVTEGLPHYQVSPATFGAFQDQSETFSGVAGYTFAWDLTYGRTEGPMLIQGLGVSSNLFEILEVNAEVGRTLLASDGEADSGTRVVLNHAFWVDHFGADPGVVGTSITLAGELVEIVGVMPAGFQIQPDPVSMWFNLRYPRDRFPFARAFHAWSLVGRLAPERTLEEGQADLLTIARRIEQDAPETKAGHLVTTSPLRDAIVGEVRSALLILLGVVGLVLMIATFNVANMSLAQAITRQREFGIRTAIGAGRGRLARQRLTESTIVAILGGGLGVLLAYLGIDGLLALSPVALPEVNEVRVDGVVLLVALASTMVAAFAVGVIPSLVERRDVTAINEAHRGGGGEGRGHRGLQQGLLLGQMAIAVFLLVGAGLLMRSFANVTGIGVGFDDEALITAQVTLPRGAYPNDAARRAFWDLARDRLAAVPGAVAVTATSSVPLDPGGFGSSLTVEGRDVPGGIAQLPTVRVHRILPGYIEGMGIPLIRGRSIAALDRDETVPVAVVNATTANRLWPDEDVIGARVKLGPNPDSQEWIEVIGVIDDVRDDGLETEVQPTLYIPVAQDPANTMTFLLRAAGDPAPLIPAFRAALREIDPGIPVHTVRTMEEVRALSLQSRRASTILLGVLAGLALFLAAIGVYGVFAYTVSRRTQEIGVRIALGAETGGILWLVIGRGLRLAGIAAVLGLAASVAGTTVLSSLLFEVSAVDPLTFLAIPVLLSAVAVLACVVPAHRASRIDPKVAMLEE